MAAGRAIAVERLVYPEQMAERLTLPSVLVSSPAHLKRLPDHLDWQAARAGVHAIDAQPVRCRRGALGIFRQLGKRAAMPRIAQHFRAGHEPAKRLSQQPRSWKTAGQL